MKKCYLSVEGKKRLKEEKKKLEEKRKKISKGVGTTKLKSDSSNTSFMSGTRELQRLRRKIEEINEILEDAEVIDIEELETDVVCPGCEVVICFPMGEVETYLVGVNDPDCNNRISLKSPLGKEIIGRKEGEVVQYSVNGKVREAKIKNII